MLVAFSGLFFLFHSANAITVRSELSPPGIRDDPYPELLEPGFKYAKPPGSGCDTPETVRLGLGLPTSTSNRELLQIPAVDFIRKKPDGTMAWNGFCQAGIKACPDAVANRDYNYYAKALGVTWVKSVGDMDALYCKNAGFLEPEIAQLRNNFTALHDKAAEMCSTTFSDPKYKQDKIHIGDGSLRAFAMGGKRNLKEILAHMKDDQSRGKPIDMPEIIITESLKDEDAAKMVGAWNCALGDAGCDMAYCNWAYCLKADGSVGTMEECEGWDPIHGTKIL